MAAPPTKPVPVEWFPPDANGSRLWKTHWLQGHLITVIDWLNLPVQTRAGKHGRYQWRFAKYEVRDEATGQFKGFLFWHSPDGRTGHWYANNRPFEVQGDAVLALP
jgi:hypothetical protein